MREASLVAVWGMVAIAVNQWQVSWIVSSFALAGCVLLLARTAQHVFSNQASLPHNKLSAANSKKVWRSTMLVLEDKGLRVSLVTGESAYFNYYWLRDNCASSWDADTQERVYDILGEPDDLKPKAASLEGNSLYIQ